MALVIPGSGRSSKLITGDRILTENNLLITPQINYLSRWFDASQEPGTISTVAANGNISSSTFPWYADTTSGSSCVTSTNVGGANLRGNLSYVSNLGAAASDGSRFFQFPAFALEQADRGKPVFVSFDFNCNGASGDYDVVVARYNSSGVFQELIPVAGTASTSSSTPSARIPGGVAQFRGFFVSGSTAGDLYALRFRRLVSTSILVVDTLYVGPQAQLAGAPVTDMQSYTPTFAGFGTVTNPELLWGRSGDRLFVEGRFTSGTNTGATVSFTLPPGLAPSDGEARQIGRWWRNSSTASANKAGPLITLGGNLVFFGIDDRTEAISPYTQLSSIALNGEIISVHLNVAPIANWSSNVTMAERAVEEYAFNTSGITAAGASDTTSFGYGAAGAVIGSIASTTTSSDTVMRVRFQTPIQATDRLVVEVSNPSASSGWIESSTYFPRLLQGTSQYGIRLDQVNGTDCDVRFGNQGAYANNATYAGSGLSWASAASGLRWRVRKVSGGAAVGFPVGSSNIIMQDTISLITGTTTLSSGATNVRYVCNSGSNFTITLPAAASVVDGTIFRFKNIGTGVVTIDGNASETIDGALTIAVNQYSSVDLMEYNGAWFII